MLLSKTRCVYLGMLATFSVGQRCAVGIGIQGCHTRGSQQIAVVIFYFGAAVLPPRWLSPLLLGRVKSDTLSDLKVLLENLVIYYGLILCKNQFLFLPL